MNKSAGDPNIAANASVGIDVNAVSRPYILTVNGGAAHFGSPQTLTSGTSVTFNGVVNSKGEGYVSLQSGSRLENSTASDQRLAISNSATFRDDNPAAYTGIIYYYEGTVDLVGLPNAARWSYDSRLGSLAIQDANGIAVYTLAFKAVGGFAISHTETDLLINPTGLAVAGNGVITQVRTTLPPSPDGTVVTTDGPAIHDRNGNDWSLRNGQVLVNGAPDATTARVVELAFVDGKIWQENADKLWWAKTTPTDSWQPSSGTPSSPLPGPGSTESPDNTIINAPGSSITDAHKNAWSIIGGKVAVNGIADPTTARVVALAYEKGRIWQENADGLWWAKTLPSDPWSPDMGTSVSPIPGVTLPQSADNTVVTATGQSIIDASHNAWSIIDGKVAVNGIVDPTTARVVALAYEKGRVWQENTNGLWWAKTLPSDPWWPDMGTLVSPIPGVTLPQSADNTVVIAAGQSIIDASHNAWSIIDGKVAVNGVVDPNTGSVILLAYEKGKIWQENADRLWWSKDTPSDHWSPNQGTPVSPIPSSTPLPPLSEPPPSNFHCVDNQSNENFSTWGTDYHGPVAGVLHEFIQITSHNLNITATVSNVFVHSGSGQDAIDVSHGGGTNVLDGGTGSNFLVGGSGPDTFFVDDRSAAADIWSTVVNFHAGCAATVWGVTAADFTLSWVDGEGAGGFTGLTLHATAAGRATASITLAGFSKADLNGGALSFSFGGDPASGSSYLFLHA